MSATSSSQPPSKAKSSPRADLHDGVGWVALGIAVLIGSWTMDRLERQDVNPYTVPGLLPGLLGIAIILLGGVMLLRSWRRGALAQPAPPRSELQREEHRRVAIVIALCLGYGVVLVGHGLPFWLSSTVFVTGAIFILQRIGQNPAQAGPAQASPAPLAWYKALAIGLCASVITQAVFQELFLVRMP